MSARRVLLIVGGGIAAYKSLELVRYLRVRNVAVTPVMTRSACEFITPLSLQTLAGEAVHTDLFSPTLESEIGHIALSRSADLVVVCPATANLMARMRMGIADDLATTLLLATTTPVLIAPAMNVRMWEHPATRDNHAVLLSRGVEFVGPVEGSMACGEHGVGRLEDADVIAERILAKLDDIAAGGSGPLSGRRALVTAGPTYEPIDPVRFIGNHSSGKQGFAVASALAMLGAEVTLVSGPVSLPTPPHVRRIDVGTAQEMLSACESLLPVDIAVCVAAVSDWRVDHVATDKLKKTAGVLPALSLVENPDILATLSATGPRRPALVVGFAAETHDMIRHAVEKFARKGCDWLLANSVGGGSGTFGGDRNTVTLLTGSMTEAWAEMSKIQVAQNLASRIALHFRDRA
ncbi:bifunctional phosphopantothenoylcysteine decarboxylase/phosphopantothenate--cysteine ligase CoaBC [Brytella acorum]|uniref:Coenzyme A biosynthesis bifunctional protein CoaBC n=1 Tax=Brytella acorum TaxID=2959299 RepID=A0AA35Y2W0_9PROT|nr:bifunctional phosphopantothenoylcysteine decarboxylase/phosphopantothenate--cysteine ligase CoaBC [Brytella acorum]MDF3624505.1 bifunctional phosphopantothenoylcysteine decarboxylase/phosphopantothenate--cysteine ligase CoaBC [Brytella acorum]CAI9119645.1 bifunctional phosphopantothenoylcysteine decarboxylase/phosphopantothenate--cysteine ligase CoaBC [Brytella acorum]